MTKYTNFKVNISQGQIDKMKKTVNAGLQVSIRLSHKDLTGEHILALTEGQINKIKKANENGTGVTIKMTKHN